MITLTCEHCEEAQNLIYYMCPDCVIREEILYSLNHEDFKNGNIPYKEGYIDALWNIAFNSGLYELSVQLERIKNDIRKS